MVAAVFLIVLFFAAVACSMAAFYGWLIMLLCGALHTAWPAVPALGFWTSALIGIVFGILTSSKTVTIKR